MACVSATFSQITFKRTTLSSSDISITFSQITFELTTFSQETSLGKALSQMTYELFKFFNQMIYKITTFNQMTFELTTSNQMTFKLRRFNQMTLDQTTCY